jgi:hypothetical protein
LDWRVDAAFEVEETLHRFHVARLRKRGSIMTDVVRDVIKLFKKRKAAVDNAITALRAIDSRDIEDDMPDWVPWAISTAKLVVVPLEGTKRSAAVRRRMAVDQEARWEKIRGH